MLKRYYRFLPVFFFCAVIAVSTVAMADSPFNYGGRAFYTVDNNVSRAQFEADIEQDRFYTVTGDVAYTLQLGLLNAISFAGSATAEEFADFDGLSNTRLAARINYRFQPSRRFGAWQWAVFAGATHIDSETDIRDSVLTEFGFTVTKRLTDRITPTLGATASKRKADGEVFDLERTRYFINVDWRLGGRWLTYLTYSYISGDVVSTSTPNDSILTWQDAIEPDNAFGGLANNKFAYRLDADTTVIRLGLNVALSHNSSIDVSYDNLETDAAGSNKYSVGSFSLGYLLQF